MHCMGAVLATTVNISYRLSFLWQELGRDKKEVAEGTVGWESLWYYVSSVKRQHQAAASAVDDGGTPMNTSELLSTVLTCRVMRLKSQWLELGFFSMYVTRFMKIYLTV